MMADCNRCKYSEVKNEDTFITTNHRLYEEWKREWTGRYRRNRERGRR